MSTISSAFDLIKTTVTTALPNHTVLVNPYDLEKNPENYLDQGVGIGYTTAINTSRTVCPQIWIRRSFFVVITRNYFTSDLNNIDKESCEKQLFEDSILVIKALLVDIFNSLSNVIAKSTFLGDNGIETVFGDKDNLLKVTIQFEMEYYETL